MEKAIPKEIILAQEQQLMQQQVFKKFFGRVQLPVNQKWALYRPFGQSAYSSRPGRPVPGKQALNRVGSDPFPSLPRGPVSMSFYCPIDGVFLARIANAKCKLQQLFCFFVINFSLIFLGLWISFV